MVDANILELRDDGTVGPTKPEGAPPIYRYCATDNHGSVAGLLAEMRSRSKSGLLPWESKEARDTAAHWGLVDALAARPHPLRAGAPYRTYALLGKSQT